MASSVERKKVVVIGGGIAGMAIAIRQAVAGNEVTLLENASDFGGKVGEFRIDGFRFDMGPSLLTLPEELLKLHNLVAKGEPFPLQLKQLSTITQYFWDDGTTFKAPSATSDFINEAATCFNEPPKNIEKFLISAKKGYNLTQKVFLRSPLNSVATWLSTDALKATIGIRHIKPLSKMHKVNMRSFKSSKLTQIFDRYATYNGSNPYVAPATLNVIAHLEHNLGAYVAEGGMRSIAKILIQYCIQTGVKMHSNVKVLGFIQSDKRIYGVKTDKRNYIADRVISAVDEALTKKWLNQSMNVNKRSRSTSAMVFFWGLKDINSNLDVHNILFSNNYEREFNVLHQLKDLDQDLTIYIYVSSKVNKSDAPAGGENWFVMVNAPYLANQNWITIIPTIKSSIVSKIEKILKLNVNNYLAFEKIMTPADIQWNTGSFLGSLYGNSSNEIKSAFLRGQNAHLHLKGLYQCGGSVHPGGGVPLCLMSAEIVDNLIQKEINV